MRHSLLPQLRARCRADLHDMRSALGQGDLACIERAAHRMIGASGALEMHDVLRQARAVHAAARAGGAPEVSEALDHLQAAVDEWKEA